MGKSIDTYIAQVQAIADRLKSGNCNKTFAAAELDRINDNFAQGNVSAADDIESTIADIVTSNDDIATAITKVNTISAQLKDSKDAQAVIDQSVDGAEVKP